MGDGPSRIKQQDDVKAQEKRGSSRHSERPGPQLHCLTALVSHLALHTGTVEQRQLLGQCSQCSQCVCACVHACMQVFLCKCVHVFCILKYNHKWTQCLLKQHKMSRRPTLMIQRFVNYSILYSCCCQHIMFSSDVQWHSSCCKDSRSKEYLMYSGIALAVRTHDLRNI